jgi:hypothetical protein
VRKTPPNETALVLLVAALFSAGAIAFLSGFLEPSQPPGVGAVKIGEPREGALAAREDRATPQAPARERQGQQAPSAPREQQTQPAPSPPVDDAGEDDAGEAD